VKSVRTSFPPFALIMLVSFLLFPLSAQSGPRDHNEGFFLRLSAGGGSAKTSICLLDEDFELSGPSGDVNLAIGAIVSPNLALHGTIWGWSVSDPDFEWGELGIGFEGTDLALSAVGGGLTYYFMPVNMYLSGSVGIGVLTLDGPGGSGETDGGLAVDVTLGKEWWVSDRWALGLSGGFGHHSIPEKDVDENWSGTSFGLRFSATLN